MPVLIAWLLVAAALTMLALVGVQSRYVGRLEGRVGWLERWAQDKDPEAFGIYPELESEPAVPECVGVHPVSRDGKTCEACKKTLVES